MDKHTSEAQAALQTPKSRPTVSLEPLEKRMLLSGVFKPALLEPPAPTTDSIRDARHGPMAKAGQTLVDLYLDYRKHRRAGGTNADYNPAAADKLKIDNARVVVSVRGTRGLDTLMTALRKYDVQCISRTGRFGGVVEAYVPITHLHALATEPGVGAINPIFKPQTHGRGNVANQAEQALRVAETLDSFGLTGAGVKIGVISDSINALPGGLENSVRLGNLPPNVQVLQDDIGEDEGRAMLELIHDLAPGADLAFHAAGGGLLSFAHAIRTLADAGCNIIVDDIGFMTQPLFGPGIVEEAIAEVTANGVTYFTAAGNNGPNGYFIESQFQPVVVAEITRNLLDLDPGPGFAHRMRFDLDAPGILVLQWDNAFNGIVGDVQADVNLRVFSASGRLRVGGHDNNFATGQPIEWVVLDEPGPNYVEIELAALRPGAQPPSYFRLMSFDGLSFANTQFEHTVMAIDGHAQFDQAITVGAVPFFNVEPFTPFPTNATSVESAHGPAVQVFDLQGNRIPLQWIAKPDMAGIEGVNNSFFGGPTPVGFVDQDHHPNFFGTSAAAANVAGVAALLLQANPTLTPAQLRQLLIDTARPVNDTPAGTFDVQGGYGLVDAFAAAATLIGEPIVTIHPVSPNPRFGAVHNITIEFNQPIEGFEVDDLVLTRNGAPLSLENAFLETENDRVFILRNITSLTAPQGNYSLVLSHVGSGIQTPGGSALVNSDAITWSVVARPPAPLRPLNLTATATSRDTIVLRWDDNSDNETGFHLQRADDPDFTVNVKTFTQPANATEFVNRPLTPPGKRFYYRIRAFNEGGVSKWGNVASAATFSANEIIIDASIPSRAVLLHGNWQNVARPEALNGNTLLDTNIDKGEGNVRFKPYIPVTGEYFIFARWTREPNAATNVPVDIFASGRQQTIRVDQRNTGGEGWVLLGRYTFQQGSEGFIRFRNANTDGLVSVDALRVLPTTVM